MKLEVLPRRSRTRCRGPIPASAIRLRSAAWKSSANGSARDYRLPGNGLVQIENS